MVRIDDPAALSMSGKFVVEYDPSRAGYSPEGFEMLCHLVVSADKDQAKRFDTIAAAWDFVRTAHGIRDDGLPNRPLTAFNYEIVSETWVDLETKVTEP